MLRNWRFSLLLLAVYASLFWVWMSFPSRSVYLVCGGLAMVVLVSRFRSAARAGYFVNRVDSRLHALVIADVFLETASFEVFRLFQPLAVAETFHRNTNFVGCATAFTLLIGCYRFLGLRSTRMAVKNVQPLAMSSMSTGAESR